MPLVTYATVHASGNMPLCMPLATYATVHASGTVLVLLVLFINKNQHHRFKHHASCSRLTINRIYWLPRCKSKEPEYLHKHEREST